MHHTADSRAFHYPNHFFVFQYCPIYVFDEFHPTRLVTGGRLRECDFLLASESPQRRRVCRVDGSMLRTKVDSSKNDSKGADWSNQILLGL